MRPFFRFFTQPNTQHKSSRTWALCVLVLMSALACGLESDVPEPLIEKEGDALFTHLLEAYVDENGRVDYVGWQKSRASFSNYLEWLVQNVPANEAPKNRQIAHLVNLYNAFTIELILRHYPVAGIQDIQESGSKDPWQIDFIPLKTGAVSLDYVEKSLLLARFTEPRVHFALVCAAVSCAPLRREAYVAERLDDQLDNQARIFLQDETKNRFEGKTARISLLFKWFKDEFTAEGSLVSYLNKYLDTKLEESVTITNLPYDWRLNKQ